ncbi:MAG: DNA polymerase III subunit gamma/tau [Saprospiraceae bacterium]|nr:DNA polymerase III subunit gamma/tau [Saprospiraceae bacterium]
MMSFVVSARKYRPQHFDDLIGQDHIAQTLKNAIKNDQLAHAFLFSGPRGVGKTTSARILAKVLNCENLSDYKACGECSSCKSFLDNASFNIFELDAASNNSVEHIRALNEQVRFQPQQGSYKIYIIDEVHMLSQAAFNAFLKTLEEPPPYAKFILATTEKHKIIPTILSRCQIFDFRRIQIKDIVLQLKTIAEKEERKFDDDALHLIAQKADGAMRDALSIYDKVVSSVEGEISYTEVAENLNVLDYEYYFKLVDGAIKEDLTQLMLIYDDIAKKGFEAEQFILGFLEHLRQLLLVKDLKTAALLDIGDNLKKRYEDQASLTSNSFLLSSLSLLNETDINIQRSQNKRLSVEISLSKMAYINRLLDKKKIFAELDEDLGISDDDNAKSPIIETKEIKSPKPKQVEIQKQAQPLPTKPSKPSKTPSSQSGNVKITPTISADIDSLLANIAEQENNIKSKNNPLSPDFLNQIFTAYKKNVESKALQSAIEFTKFQISDDTITVLTPTQIYIDYIRQELALIEKIHEEFPEKDLKVKFEVSEETFPDYKPPKKPKHLTTKEKYEMLLIKNADFKLLVEELKLKISN